MITGIPHALLDCEGYLSRLGPDKDRMRCLRLEVLADGHPAAVVTDGCSLLLVRWCDPHVPGTMEPGYVVDVPLPALRSLRAACKRHDGHCGLPSEWQAEKLVGGGQAFIATGNGPRSVTAGWEDRPGEGPGYPDWRSVARLWGKKEPEVEDASALLDATPCPDAPKRPTWRQPVLGLSTVTVLRLVELLLRLGMDGTVGIDKGAPGKPASFRSWTGTAPKRLYAFGLLMPATVDGAHWSKAWEGPGLHLPSLAVPVAPAAVPVEAPGRPVEAVGAGSGP